MYTLYIIYLFVIFNVIVYRHMACAVNINYLRLHVLLASSNVNRSIHSVESHFPAPLFVHPSQFGAQATKRYNRQHMRMVYHSHNPFSHSQYPYISSCIGFQLYMVETTKNVPSSKYCVFGL